MDFQVWTELVRAIKHSLDNMEMKKVLLMGKSGSGKSSMRNIIFSNYRAKDVRRLGATIDVEHSNIKFLGNLTLNLWDCGGQDAFTGTYLTTQKSHVFSDVGVLIYVFDVESRSFDRDLATYTSINTALAEFSPNAHVFALVHKIDLVNPEFRTKVVANREAAIIEASGSFKETLKVFGTSIWDQSLYKAWGGIVNSLIPNLDVMEEYLWGLMEGTMAEEITLFEKATFLAVMKVTSEAGKENPYPDRDEKMSNMVKTFKASLAKFTGDTPGPDFCEKFCISTPRFGLIIEELTPNTYVCVVLPPGEAELNCAKLNIAIARESFASMDFLGGGKEVGGGEGGQGGQGSGESVEAGAQI